MKSLVVAAILGIFLSSGAWGAVKFNPDYFAHPAFVMQGVSDRDEIFAMPLNGVPELGTHVLLDNASATDVTWNTASSDPSLVGTAIEDEVLYIWGADSASTGTGSVILTADSSSGTAAIEIPVVVFQQDKTLVNSERIKDYFVPWSPQLDINRILSVEEHMAEYGKHEGLLDRSYRWSRWRKMWQLKDVTKSTFWMNEAISGGFEPWETTRRIVDLYLNELRTLGVGTIRIENFNYISTLSGTEIYPVYDSFCGGATMTEAEIAYMVNEAHRLGMAVSNSSLIAVDCRSMGGHYYEIWEANPSSMDEYWDSYEEFVLELMRQSAELGVEIAAIDNSGEYVGPDTWENREKTSDAFIRIAEASREIFPGALVAYAGKIGDGFPFSTHPTTSIRRSTLEAPFWEAVDILSCGVFNGWQALTATANPTKGELIVAWEEMIAEYLAPFVVLWNKPYIAYENGCFSVPDGARWSAYGTLVDRDLVEGDFSVDLDSMRTYYSSFFEAFSDFEGYYGPGWYNYDFTSINHGGIHDYGIMPRLKVDDILAAAFGGTIPGNAITVDGVVADWEGIPELAHDPAGDAVGGGDDLVAVKGFADGGYVYFLVDFADRPSGDLILFFYLDAASRHSYKLAITQMIEAVYRGNETNRRWVASLQNTRGAKRSMGFADVAVKGSSMEIRLPLLFFRVTPTKMSVRFDDYAADYSRFDDRIDGIYEIDGI